MLASFITENVLIINKKHMPQKTTSFGCMDKVMLASDVCIKTASRATH